MSPERWRQVAGLCDSALSVEPARRTAYLEEACAGDRELRREVEALLATGDYLPEFLEAPVLEMAASAMSERDRKVEPERFPAGFAIGPYRIVAFLGSGGMGEVYQAAAPQLGGEVALKLLPEQAARDRLALERFEREARAASRLNHPNICALYDVGEYEGRPFMVLELLEGESLKQRLAAGPLPPAELVEVALQISDALGAAHASGIIHRDIKPANVFLTTRGQVKIVDFGLAKLLSEPGRLPSACAAAPGGHAPVGGDTISLPGAVMGTVAYMSPEQARGEEVDTRTDLFSLGVTLYEMATGRSPFRPAASPATVEALLNEPPVRPREVNPLLPPELEQIILKALEKDPDLRYQHIAALRSDLNGAKGVAVRDLAVPGGQTSDLCLKGRSLSRRRTPDMMFQALHYYERAVEIDPGCAEGWAGIAECYTWMALFGMDPIGANGKAHAAARRAVELDGDSPAAHLAYGLYHYAMGWDWQVAEREMRRALELSSGSAIIREWLSWVLIARGRLHEAILMARSAIALNPFSASAHVACANAFYIARRYPEAERALWWSLGIADPDDPNFFFIQGHLGLVYLAGQHYPEAVENMSRAAEAVSGAPVILACYGLASVLNGNREEMERVLSELKNLTRAAPVPPVAFALIYAGIGEVELAFDCLRQACEQHSPLIHWVTYPVFDVLRSDPRLTGLLRGVGLPAGPEDLSPLPAVV